MKHAAVFTLLVLVTLCAHDALARDWNIDDNHSQAVFSIRHVAGEVTGFFNRFEGRIEDPDIPGSGMIDVDILVDSVNTGVGQRDAHLKTPDFFDAAKYPHMRFTSTQIVRLDDGMYEAHGALTIKSVTKPLVLPFTLTEPKPYPMMPGMECMDVRGFSAHTSLSRLEFKVGDGKFRDMGIVDDAVGIVLHGELLSPREGCK